MKMLGVCFGVGDGWAEAARWAAARMERVTGIECAVIAGAAPGFDGARRHPSWWKCRVFDLVPGDVDAVTIFDADVIACDYAGGPDLRAEIYEAAIARPVTGALDVDSVSVRSECACYGVPLGQYVNCGFLVVRRNPGQMILDAAWQLGPRYGSWLEQTAVNVARLRQAYGGQADWPRGWQRMLPARRGPFEWAKVNHPKGSGPVAPRVVHVTGLGSQLEVLGDLQKQVDAT